MEVLLRAPADEREAELEPDTILPTQLGDRVFGGARVQPEKRLQLAVLEDALLTFNRLVAVRDDRRGRHRRGRLFAEVDAWFASDDADGPFTFVTICDTLNLDPGYIRRGLERWRARANGTAKRRPALRREAIGTRHRVVSVPLRRIA